MAVTAEFLHDPEGPSRGLNLKMFRVRRVSEDKVGRIPQ